MDTHGRRSLDGAIPVTLIKKGKEKYFINKAVTYDQLEEAIAQFR
ncbi:hypothetical protein JCM19294_878 [Nonlabens tegetincola]|uniref:Uncharacterized protein n=1 Tax=Nonlabens tegetincola TaxID=323273 RepID=A0A090Q572_9FLAO|nr:hypothetical protein JCM19294_878 [Nonlabens tegetincola]